VIKTSQRHKRSPGWVRTTPRAPRKHSPGCCIVPERMGVDGFAETSALGSSSAGVPNHFVTDGVVGGVMGTAGKQPHFRFASEAPIMLAQFLVESGAERNFAVLAPFALANVNAHHRLVDVDDLKVSDLGTSCAGTVGGHQQRAVEWGIGGID